MEAAIKNGFINPSKLLFASKPENEKLIGAIDSLENEVSLYQSNPAYHASEMLLAEVKRIVQKWFHSAE